MEKKDLIEEARRYVDNAHKTLKDNENYDPDTRCYDDKKYVRSAGHYLWHAVMLALLNTSYQILHLSMGYDGVLYKDTCDTGFSVTNDIIDRCERLRGQ